MEWQCDDCNGDDVWLDYGPACKQCKEKNHNVHIRQRLKARFVCASCHVRRRPAQALSPRRAAPRP